MTDHPTLITLLQKLEKSSTLESVLALLGWDQQVNLPPKSVEERARQLSAMSELAHHAATDPEIETLLQELEGDLDHLNQDEKIILKHARKDYDRSTKLPSAFVAEKAHLDAEAYGAWVDARANDDFEAFRPYLEKQVAMSLEAAGYMGHADKPYDYLLDIFDPGLTTEAVEDLFGKLKEQLLPIVKQILDSTVKPDTSFLKGFPINKQDEFLTLVTKQMGFDFDHGRIDTAVHPFCTGTAVDTRLTTRYFEDDPLDSLTGALHEMGHGLYQQGLSAENGHNALGQHVGMAIHESQSRTWENQVGRSREFWQHFEPKYREAFPEQLKGISSDDLFLATNRVQISPIRVDSDEVTYNLHIILRFELEKKLISGELSVKDLPAEWNRLSEEIVGHTPESNKTGVLQDVHWSGGMFGYFPSYCVGNMIAAQFWYAALKDLPNLTEDFAQGKFDRLLKWLRENVHCHGKRYNTQELVKKVSGEEINPDYLIRYLKERYLPIYT